MFKILVCFFFCVFRFFLGEGGGFFCIFLLFFLIFFLSILLLFFFIFCIFYVCDFFTERGSRGFCAVMC